MVLRGDWTSFVHQSRKPDSVCAHRLAYHVIALYTEPNTHSHAHTSALSPEGAWPERLQPYQNYSLKSWSTYMLVASFCEMASWALEHITHRLKS